MRIIRIVLLNLIFLLGLFCSCTINNLTHAQNSVNERDTVLQRQIDSLFDSAENLFYQQPGRALATFRQITHLPVIDSSKYAETIRKIGGCQYLLGYYDSATTLYMHALQIFERQSDTAGIARSYNNLGLNLSVLGDIESAARHHHKSIELSKKTNQTKMVGQNYQNLSVAFTEPPYLDSSLYYAEKAIQTFQSINDSLMVAMGYNRKAYAHYQLQNYDSAIYWADYLLNDYKPQSRYEEEYAYAILALSYYETDNYKKSLEFGKKSYTIAKEVNALWDLQLVTRVLAESYAQQGDYKAAYEMFVEHKNLNDSILNTEKKNRINYLLRKQQELENARLQEANKLKEERILVKNLQLLFVYITVLAFGILLFMQWRNSKRKNRLYAELQESNEAISVQANELKRLNANLVKLSSFRDNMTSMIAHDLKNPLNQIINATSGDLQVRLKRAVNASRQMLVLVLNLLDVYKYKESNLKIDPKPVSLLQLINVAIENVDFLAKNKQIAIVAEVSDCIIVADFQVVKRVLVNLFTNAIKFSPQNEKIIISQNPDFENCDGEFLKISIKDKGPGIKDDKLAFIFQPYAQITAKDSGNVGATGLGLAFCKMAIEAHGGKIGVENKHDVGVAFWFTVKLYKGEFTGNTPPRRIDADTEESEKLELNEDEAAELIKIEPQLRKLEIYYTGEIEKFCSTINFDKTNNLRLWKNALDKALYHLDEKKYRYLVEIISNSHGKTKN